MSRPEVTGGPARTNGFSSIGAPRARPDSRLPRFDKRPGGFPRARPEGRAGVLPGKPRHALVGRHGLDRRDGDVGSDLPVGPRRLVPQRVHFPAARLRLRHRAHRRLLSAPARLLRGRALDRLPAPGKTLRRLRAEGDLVALHGYARDGGGRAPGRAGDPDRADSRLAGLGGDSAPSPLRPRSTRSWAASRRSSGST